MVSLSRVVVADAAAVSDLAAFAARASRLDPDGAVRVQGFAGGVACFVAPLFPAGLHDPTPTVLGVRTVPATGGNDLDTVLPLGEFSAALARADPGRGEIVLESGAPVVWTAISPPRRGWAPIAAASDAVVAGVLASGVAEVADGAGPGSGASAVRRLRGLVWGRADESLGGAPAGAAFALDGLGFRAGGVPVTVFRSGPWFRIAAPYGDVIARTRPAL